jgi:hypothetical protein
VRIQFCRDTLHHRLARAEEGVGHVEDRRFPAGDDHVHLVQGDPQPRVLLRYELPHQDLTEQGSRGSPHSGGALDLVLDGTFGWSRAYYSGVYDGAAVEL